MKHIEINIWKACNFWCIFCMSWLTKDKLLWFEKLETIKTEIRKLKNLWYESIWFLWWEPTIHPKLIDIITYAKNNNFKNIEIISNWSTFYDKNFLNDCIKSWLTRISVSLHSINNKQEEILSGNVNWVLEKKILSIKNILALYNKWFLKKELSVNIVISKANYKNIKKTILFLFKIWVNSFRLNFIQLEWNSTKYYELLAIRYEEFKKYLKEILELTKNHKKLKINFESIPWCFSGLSYIDYLKFSEQKIDMQKDKVSRDDSDFISREIKNQKILRRNLKSYLKKCENCFLKDNCEWIWNRYLNYFKLN